MEVPNDLQMEQLRKVSGVDQYDEACQHAV